MPDWREPFVELKRGLEQMFQANQTLRHVVILSSKGDEQAESNLIPWLEPAFFGARLASIRLETEGCAFHRHVFFGRDRSTVEDLSRLLDGIEEWVYHIPPRHVPTFAIPRLASQRHINLVTWASLVYYVARRHQAAYLPMEIECQESIDRLGFNNWDDCPRPSRCEPLQWLFHRAARDRGLPVWQQKFLDRGQRLPDVIDAYVDTDFIVGSIAAIDLFTSFRPGERRLKPGCDRRAEERQRPKAKSTRVEREVRQLKRFLLEQTLLRSEKAQRFWADCQDSAAHHQSIPLTAVQIAVEMGWMTPKGLPDQTKVSRRMAVIFGPDPMRKYRRTFMGDAEQYRARLDDGTFAGERTVTDDMGD